MLYGAANPFSNSQRSVQPHSWKYFPTFHKKQPELPFVCGIFRLAVQSPVFLFPIEKSSGASVCKAVYVLHFDRKLTFQCYKTYIIKGRLAITGCPWVYLVKQHAENLPHQIRLARQVFDIIPCNPSFSFPDSGYCFRCKKGPDLR